MDIESSCFMIQILALAGHKTCEDLPQLEEIQTNAVYYNFLITAWSKTKNVIVQTYKLHLT